MKEPTKNTHGGAGRGQGAKKKPETATHQVNIDKVLRDAVIEKLGTPYVNAQIRELFKELEKLI